MKTNKEPAPEVAAEERVRPIEKPVSPSSNSELDGPPAAAADDEERTAAWFEDTLVLALKTVPLEPGDGFVAFSPLGENVIVRAFGGRVFVRRNATMDEVVAFLDRDREGA